MIKSKTSRFQVEVYRGYPIIEETNIEVNDYGRVVNTSEYFSFGIKDGDITKQTDRIQHYDNTIEKIKSMIDSVEDDNAIVLTESEWYKWVSRPNRVNHWGFTYRQLLAIMNQYKKASKKRRYAYIERLNDANFHTEAYLLENEDYDNFLFEIKKMLE